MLGVTNYCHGEVFFFFFFLGTAFLKDSPFGRIGSPEKDCCVGGLGWLVNLSRLLHVSISIFLQLFADNH